MPKIKNWTRVNKKGLNQMISEELGFRTTPYKVWEYETKGNPAYVVVASRSRPRSGSLHKVVYLERNAVTGEFYHSEKLTATGHRQQEAVDEAVKWMRNHPNP
jgi:hypothetical protein